jgi:hypothetical protein
MRSDQFGIRLALLCARRSALPSESDMKRPGTNTSLKGARNGRRRHQEIRTGFHGNLNEKKYVITERSYLDLGSPTKRIRR